MPQIKPLSTIVYIIIFIFLEWLGRENKYGIESFGFKRPRIVRWSFYYVLIILILSFSGKEQEFIYFQF
jgi:hypothetical protein